MLLPRVSVGEDALSRVEDAVVYAMLEDHGTVRLVREPWVACWLELSEQDEHEARVPIVCRPKMAPYVCAMLSIAQKAEKDGDFEIAQSLANAVRSIKKAYDVRVQPNQTQLFRHLLAEGYIEVIEPAVAQEVLEQEERAAAFQRFQAVERMRKANDHSLPRWLRSLLIVTVFTGGCVLVIMLVAKCVS